MLVEAFYFFLASGMPEARVRARRMRKREPVPKRYHARQWLRLR
jgi:hypothetical protein